MNRHGIRIRARRWYATADIPALGIRSETLRVVGFAPVTVGLGVTERVERWCRVREEGARRALGVLMHPDTFVAALGG